MRALRRLVKRFSAWTRTGRDEERLRAEIEEHLAPQTLENLRAGLSPVEARRQAALKFGAVEAMKEGYREQRGLLMHQRRDPPRDCRAYVRRMWWSLGAVDVTGIKALGSRIPLNPSRRRTKSNSD
jgi:hypothetical protein